MELPEHRVDVPEAVAEHDLVVRAAEALDTLSRNEHALAFYESVGFVWDGMSETQFGRGHRMHIDVPLSPSGMPAVDRVEPR